MDLHSGEPYWIIKNQLYDYYHPLREDVTTAIAVIGAGITGALVTHELCQAGFDCCVVDKRSIGTGSTAASTALLQYEIDQPLCELSKLVGEDEATLAYVSCLQAISDLQRTLRSTGTDADYRQVPSIFYATGKKGWKLIKKEYRLREKHHLPAELLEKKKLADTFHLHTPEGALVNFHSAQIDAYKAATGLFSHHMKTDGLRIFTHTEVTGWHTIPGGIELQTNAGHVIRCEKVIVAAGFEAGTFLPKPVMQLTSTYALASHPVDPEYLWPQEALIWNTDDPYLYIRTTEQNRIIIGGEDETFSDPERRDKLLRKKVRTLLKKFHRLFPDIPVSPEMTWCATFSTTRDGLPFIGKWNGLDSVYFALGYGGNGITYSMIAAQLICNELKGIKDERKKVFGFDRIKK